MCDNLGGLGAADSDDDVEVPTENPNAMGAYMFEYLI